MCLVNNSSSFFKNKLHNSIFFNLSFNTLNSFCFANIYSSPFLAVSNGFSFLDSPSKLLINVVILFTSLLFSLLIKIFSILKEYLPASKISSLWVILLSLLSYKCISKEYLGSPSSSKKHFFHFGCPSESNLDRDYFLTTARTVRPWKRWRVSRLTSL